MGLHTFVGKSVVVTGAASGFGAATARRFAELGAHVVLADVDVAGANAIAAEIGGRARAVEVDVRDAHSVERMVDFAEAEFGGLDILVNNAGVARRSGPVEDSSVEDFEFVFDVNVKGVFLGIKYGVPALRRRGGGVILNTSSIAVAVPRRYQLIYTASKAAIASMTRSAALELAPEIRVNSVLPVTSVTGMVAAVAAGDAEELGRMRTVMQSRASTSIPMARLVEPEEIAAAFTFLASDDAKFLTGVNLPVDGGRSAGDTT
jgi:3-oxoacyl-[acyl-carrier protein] reductase